MSQTVARIQVSSCRGAVAGHIGALAAALVRRGHEEQAALLATDLGTAVLRIATRRWLESDDKPEFATLLSAGARELLAVAGTARG